MRALTVALLALGAAAAPAAAQVGTLRYDPTAEVTLTGAVVDLHESKARNDHPGLHFILRPAPEPAGNPDTGADPGAVEGEGTAEAPVTAPEPGTIEVHACPIRLLSQLDFPIEKGDELTVTGSRPEGGPVLIAREIRRGVVSLQLRDEKGVPIWEGLR